MAGLGVDHRGGEDDLATGFDLEFRWVDPHLDGAHELAGVVCAVEEVLADIGVVDATGLGRRIAGGRRHVAVLADDAGRRLGALFPLEMGGLDPESPRVLLVVAGAAELGGADIGIDHDLVARALDPGAGSLGAGGRIDGEIEVERHLAVVPGDGVAEGAADAFVGAGSFGGWFWWDIACEEGEGRVAAVAAGLDAGNLLDLSRSAGGRVRNTRSRPSGG